MAQHFDMSSDETGRRNAPTSSQATHYYGGEAHAKTGSPPVAVDKEVVSLGVQWESDTLCLHVKNSCQP